jgi:chemotaxis signal transduction protein
VSTQSSGPDTYVVFPLGVRRFALPTTNVVELSRSGLVQKFPHTTPGMLGILIRRGEILPVWDVAETLLGPGKVALKYWLITRRNSSGEELTAIPVSGECQMLHSVMMAPPEGAAAHVRGVLSLDDQFVEVLDLARLATAESQDQGVAVKKEVEQ